MKEATGDLWTYPADYRVVTTNGILDKHGCLVMGAGVAKQAKLRFPHLSAKLGRWVVSYGNRPFICKDEGLLTYPTKRHWRDASDMGLIREGAISLMAIVRKFGVKSVVMTRPGCGNGQLRWPDVCPVIANILDDRFTVLGP